MSHNKFVTDSDNPTAQSSKLTFDNDVIDAMKPYSYEFYRRNEI